MDDRTTRVSHPILRLSVVRSDGTRDEQHKVFCRYQRRSIAVGTCCACAHCDAIDGEPAPAVVCSIPCAPEDVVDDPDGELTEVGAVLREGMIALDPLASVGDALAVLRSSDRHSVAVVDAEAMLVGVVHEVTFVRPGKAPADDVAAAMSSALAIHESTPVRRALRLLASAHLREATVTDDAGVPLGVFRDIDGLRWLARARIRAREGR